MKPDGHGAITARRSMRSPTWRLVRAGGGDGGDSEWRAEERGTLVRDWGGVGPTAVGVGTVEGAELAGGVWHHLGVLETDHLGAVGWSVWFHVARFYRRHLALLARIPPYMPP